MLEFEAKPTVSKSEELGKATSMHSNQMVIQEPPGVVVISRKERWLLNGDENVLLILVVTSVTSVTQYSKNASLFGALQFPFLVPNDVCNSHILKLKLLVMKVATSQIKEPIHLKMIVKLNL
jgi:hypothetical protein